MEIDYVGILVQWLIFFGILSIFLLPALSFRNIANINGEKGWLYFLFGMGVGMVALQAGRLMIYIFIEVVSLQEENQPYLLSIIMFITAYVIIALSIAMLKRRMLKRNN